MSVSRCLQQRAGWSPEGCLRPAYAPVNLLLVSVVLVLVCRNVAFILEYLQKKEASGQYERQKRSYPHPPLVILPSPYPTSDPAMLFFICLFGFRFVFETGSYIAQAVLKCTV